MSLKILSPADQVSSFIREEIYSGRWKDEMPGIAHLQSKLGVNHVTINDALQMLENEGLLISQGRRRRRKIADTRDKCHTRKLRIRLIPYDKDSYAEPDCLGIISTLNEQGYNADFSRKSLHEMGMNTDRIARFVNKVDADGWIVSAANEEIFHWFAKQNVPTIALFGRFSSIPIAGVGVRKIPITNDLIDRLVRLGHRRIVVLCHKERIEPEPGLYERNFLKQMANHGITTGAYNLPVWEPTQAGLHQCLDKLFQHTAPTALIIDEPRYFIAVQNYLTSNSIKIPDDVSLVCGDFDPSFSWCDPQITYMKWDTKKLINHVVRWINQVALGKQNYRQKFYDAELVEGGTIAPPPR